MRTRRILALASLFCALAPAAAGAKEPYQSYSYDYRNNERPQPNSYEPAAFINGELCGVGAFREPEDIYASEALGRCYLLDSGNRRIVVLDEKLGVDRVIGGYEENGEFKPFSGLHGIFVNDDASYYVSDRDGQQVLYLDSGDRLLHRFEKPDSPLYLSETFSPGRMAADASGNLYVISIGSYEGAVIFDKNHEFSGYYGATKVRATPSVIISSMWKKLMTEEQKSKMSRTVPVEYASLDIDGENFMFTVTVSQNASEKLRKLNPKGENVFSDDMQWGDHSAYTYRGIYYASQFNDLCVDRDGFINALDFSGSKVFQYDSEGNQICVLGVYGSQLGSFRQPVAVDAFGERILVLDRQKAGLAVFAPTEYGALLREATLLYNSGLYNEALAPWEKVMGMDENLSGAFTGLGDAYMNLGEYGRAMEYFEQGMTPFTRYKWSEAFRQHRLNLLRDNFGWIMAGAGALIVLLLLWARKPRKKPAFNAGTPKIRYPLHILFHPSDGFIDLAAYRAESYRLAACVAALWFAASAEQFLYSGPAFNQHIMQNINLFMILGETVGLLAVGCAANWAFCTLLDGKGSFSQIVTVACYSLIPYTLSIFAGTLLSRALAQEEGLILVLLNLAGIGWSALLLLRGMSAIHDYDFGKTLASLLLTAAGMAAILFVVVLLCSLYKQVADFFLAVYTEIMFRFL
jgi:tetratricopeptide (TPR) repeat protein